MHVALDNTKGVELRRYTDMSDRPDIARPRPTGVTAARFILPTIRITVHEERTVVVRSPPSSASDRIGARVRFDLDALMPNPIRKPPRMFRDVNDDAASVWSGESSVVDNDARPRRDVSDDAASVESGDSLVLENARPETRRTLFKDTERMPANVVEQLTWRLHALQRTNKMRAENLAELLDMDKDALSLAWERDAPTEGSGLIPKSRYAFRI